MALKDLLKLVDDKLEKTFNERPYDPSKARGPILRMIDRTKQQFASTETPRGRKSYAVKNNTVRFSPGFAVGGKTEHYVPSERFNDYLDHFRGAVEGGELDNEIAEAAKSGGTKSRGGSGKGWSPERRARYEATLANRRKGK